MENNNRVPVSSFTFDGYRVHKSSLTLSEAKMSQKMQFEINPSGEFLEDNRFELILDVHVNDEQHFFDVSIEIHGFFKYQTTDMGNLANFISINAPAIMFPYIRAYVSTLTSLSGIPTITLPTLNMESVGKQLREKIEIKLKNENI